jgi:hypothetical protein
MRVSYLRHQTKNTEHEDDCLLGRCALYSDRRFRDAYYLLHTHRPDYVGSEHLWNVGQFLRGTRRNIPEDSHLHIRRSENLKSHNDPVLNTRYMTIRVRSLEWRSMNPVFSPDGSYNRTRLKSKNWTSAVRNTGMSAWRPSVTPYAARLSSQITHDM